PRELPANQCKDCKAVYDEILDTLLANKDERWLTVSHLRPDGDATGSLTAITLLLRALEIESVAYAPEGCPMGTEPILEVAQPVTELESRPACIFAVDSGRAKALGVDLQAAKVIINLDHHAANERYGSHNFVDSEAATAS